MTDHRVDEDRFSKLLALAHDKFASGLSAVEIRALRHSMLAENLPIPSESEDRPGVRSTFIRWLATDPSAQDFIDPKGIRIWSATILGSLDLQGCTIASQMHFLGCTFQERLNLFSAELPALYLLGGEVTQAVLAPAISVRGVLYLRNLTASATIRMVGATIGRNLDCSGSVFIGEGPALVLDGASIGGSIFLHEGFKASGEIRMLNARVGGDIGLNGAELTAGGKALSFDKAIIQGNLSLSAGFKSSGEIGIPGGQILGDLDCAGSILSSVGLSLNLASSDIRGHVYLRQGFRASGQICLHSARVGKTLDCSGAILSHPSSTLLLEETIVGGTVYLCDGFECSGRVELAGAHLHKNLACEGAALGVLYCANMKLDGDLIWTGIKSPKTTVLILNGANVKSLRDERESWPGPGRLHVNGLTYESLILHEARTPSDRDANAFGRSQKINVADRIDWLNLQPVDEQAEPQPWIRFAELLKSRGESRAASHVVFELRRHQAQTRWLPIRWWKMLVGWLEEQPLRVFVPIIFLTSLASCLFYYAASKGAMAPTTRDEYVSWSIGDRYHAAYPKFNPIIYSLENILPILKLGQNDKWAPDPNYRAPSSAISYGCLSWVRLFLIVAGWVLATALAAAIASRFKT